jgi:hypothetical protein
MHPILRTLLFGGNGGGAAQSSLLTGILHYWPLDDENDVVDNAHFTNNGGLFAAGEVELDGATDFLEVADRATLSIGTNLRYFALWCHPETINSGVNTAICAKEAGSLNKGFSVFIDAGTGKVRFSVFNAGSAVAAITNNATMSAGGDYLIEFYVDRSGTNEAGIAVNGGVFTTATLSGDPGDDTSDFTLGKNEEQSGFGLFDGTFKNCGVWNRMLTEDERTILAAGYQTGDEYPWS